MHHKRVVFQQHQKYMANQPLKSFIQNTFDSFHEAGLKIMDFYLFKYFQRLQALLYICWTTISF